MLVEDTKSTLSDQDDGRVPGMDTGWIACSASTESKHGPMVDSYQSVADIHSLREENRMKGFLLSLDARPQL